MMRLACRSAEPRTWPLLSCLAAAPTVNLAASLGGCSSFQLLLLLYCLQLSDSVLASHPSGIAFFDYSRGLDFWSWLNLPQVGVRCPLEAVLRC